MRACLTPRVLTLAPFASPCSTLAQLDNVWSSVPNFTAINEQVATMAGYITSPPVNLSNINGTIWSAQGTRNGEDATFVLRRPRVPGMHRPSTLPVCASC